MSNLREEIAELVNFDCASCDWINSKDCTVGTKSCKRIWEQADSILILIDQHFDEFARERGYTKLDENVSTAKITLKDGRIFVWSK